MMRTEAQFEALPLKYRVGIMLACLGMMFIGLELFFAHGQSDLEMAAAGGGCAAGAVALYMLGIRIAGHVVWRSATRRIGRKLAERDAQARREGRHVARKLTAWQAYQRLGAGGRAVLLLTAVAMCVIWVGALALYSAQAEHIEALLGERAALAGFAFLFIAMLVGTMVANEWISRALVPAESSERRQGTPQRLDAGSARPGQRAVEDATERTAPRRSRGRRPFGRRPARPR